MHRDRQSIRLSLQVLFLLLTSHLSGCAIVYSSADVDGRIIDSETKEPIEDAVVVGIWQLESQGLEHHYGDAIHVVESVTDKTGRYHLEGFEGLWVANRSGSLMGRDPILFILAEGYKPIGKGRDFNDQSAKGTHRISPLIGQAIPMQKMALGNINQASSWSSSVRMIIDNSGRCGISNIPAALALIRRIEPQYTKVYEETFGRSEKLVHTSQVSDCK